MKQEFVKIENIRTFEDMCGFLGTNPTRLLSWVLGNKIPCLTNVTGTYFDIEAVEQWIADGKYLETVAENIELMKSFINLKNAKNDPQKAKK